MPARCHGDLLRLSRRVRQMADLTLRACRQYVKRHGALATVPMVKETGMNTYGAVVIALGVVLTFVSPAWAQRTEPPPAFDPPLLGPTLYAGPLGGAGHWRCNVLNAGSTPLIVSVEIRNPAGTELAVDPDSQN